MPKQQVVSRRPHRFAVTTLCLGTLSLTALGCESDPILAPQQDTQDGGSYGLVAFDPQGRDKKMKKNEDGDTTTQTPNPERF